MNQFDLMMEYKTERDFEDICDKYKYEPSIEDMGKYLEAIRKIWSGPGLLFEKVEKVKLFKQQTEIKICSLMKAI